MDVLLVAGVCGRLKCCCGERRWLGACGLACLACVCPGLDGGVDAIPCRSWVFSPARRARGTRRSGGVCARGGGGGSRAGGAMTYVLYGDHHGTVRLLICRRGGEGVDGVDESETDQHPTLIAHVAGDLARAPSSSSSLLPLRPPSPLSPIVAASLAARRVPPARILSPSSAAQHLLSPKYPGVLLTARSRVSVPLLPNTCYRLPSPLCLRSPSHSLCAPSSRSRLVS